MGAKVEDRHERILRLVREHGSIRISELAEALGTSGETVRRDVRALYDSGQLRRVHGSVSLPTAPLSARDARLAASDPHPGPHTTRIGMVSPVAGYFYEGIIRGARAAAGASKTRLHVATTDYNPDLDAMNMASMVQAGIRGLLLSPSWGREGPSDDDLDALAALTVPAVLVERALPPTHPLPMIDQVCSAHAEGMALAVRHLAGLGHRRIAFLSQNTPTMPQIREGYHATMRRLGLAADDLIPDVPRDGPEAHEEELRRLFALIDGDDVRAAVVHTDVDAINLLQRLEMRGVRVPEDFALVSYDDELATIADVPLTAIAPAKYPIGETAARLLLNRIADPTMHSLHVRITPQLHVRASCGAARGGKAS